MTVLLALTFLLLLMTMIVFKKSSLYMITGTFMNLGLFILLLFLISRGYSVYGTACFIFLGITIVTLFYINDINQKTLAAFICVVGFLCFFSAVTIPLIQVLKTHGFPVEELDELQMMDFTVSVPFSKLNFAIILMSFSGAVIDSSMAVSSSTYEIYQRTKPLVWKEFLNSSLTVVQEIVSTTVNTLLFAFLGSSLGLIIWMQDLEYTLIEWINSQALAGELLISVLTCLAAIIILPLTSLVASYIFFHPKFFSKRSSM